MSGSLYRDLATEWARRAARATISQLGPRNPALQAELTHRLERPMGEEGSFLAPPVFESLFDWERDERALSDLDVFHPALLDAMANPPAHLGQRAFPGTIRPFKHQVRAWEALMGADPRSVIVSTGTASGKTECFLLPILDDLVREVSTDGPLSGVRAIFLYPLNALIHSQRERLEAWTSGLGADVRFCLYNGYTRRTEPPSQTQRQHPSEVLSRPALRGDPPPLLVTNATMLEYMLVRAEDRPILDRSRGKLRWIVLDEAHTYVGANAAEIACCCAGSCTPSACDRKKFGL